MRLTLPYPPTLNNLYATVRGRRVLSREGRRYKQRVGAIAYRSGISPTLSDVAVTVHVYRPRRSGDLDNTLKALFDSLKGLAWVDDAQVTAICATRHEDKHHPRVEISVVGKADCAG